MISNDADQQFQAALTSEEKSASLFDFAVSLKQAGATQRELYDFLLRKHQERKSDIDEEAYDAIGDTLDSVAGWCGNEAFRIYESKLPNQNEK